MRAAAPTLAATVERDGVDLYYEVYGDSGPTILLLPTWEFIYSRAWKMQIPYLARHYRVVTYDAAGSGQSTRPRRPDRYSHMNRVADALAVMDATGTVTALAVGYSMGGETALMLSALHPDRFPGVISTAGSHPWRVPHADRIVPTWDPESGAKAEGWAKFNAEYWRRDWKDFTTFFMTRVNSDPHSTKGIDDCIKWGLEQEPDVLEWTITDNEDFDIEDLHERLATSTVPTLIIHGTADEVTSHANAVVSHQLIPGSELVLIEGAGHALHTRYPVAFNHRVMEFAVRVLGPGHAPLPSADDLAVAVHVAPASAGQRVLYLSSPIGLGHSRRDLAIAQELRALHPDVQIDWLAQDPVTRVLAAAGETLHPASAVLAGESEHIEHESGEHNLAVFQAIRTMDEILVHNFMVFDEVASAGNYDLVIADESWEVDHFLFENPRLKRGAFAWMTDFVGYLPMPSRGAREAEVAADYNLEMINHVARQQQIRDAAVFVGEPDDIVDATFGPGLPDIREWTEANFDFSGFVTGFDPAALGDRDALRAEFGYREDQKVCIVAVGGSGVGVDLVRRVVAGAQAARRAVPALRMIVVTGPRLDPAVMPQAPGVEYRAYVPDLHRHLAACDLAIVQGGLSTTMELTAAKVPFIYVPLREHFEQNFHVRARLDRYRAGRCMDYDDLTPDALAQAVVEELGRTVDYLDVEGGGAARAASMLARLL